MGLYNLCELLQHCSLPMIDLKNYEPQDHFHYQTNFTQTDVQLCCELWSEGDGSFWKFIFLLAGI